MLVKFGILIFSLLFWSANSMEATDKELVKPVEKDYTFKIRNEIAKKIWGQENGVFPIECLRGTFALVYPASYENTQKALNSLFEYETFPKKNKEIGRTSLYHPVDFYTKVRKDFKEISDSTDGVELRLANTIFVNSRLQPDDRYTKTLSKLNEGNGGELVQVMDFSDRKNVVTTMNQFLKDNAKITHDVFDTDAIDDETSLFAINSIYLKGKWKKKFQREKYGFFNTPNGQILYPNMMYQEQPAGDNFDYIKGENISGQVFELLEMKFENSDISLVIELPDTKNFQEYIPLSREEFQDFFRQMRKPDAKMKVTVPDFEIESKYKDDLQELLKNKNMGLADIFDQFNANFPFLMKEDQREQEDTAYMSDIIAYAKISVKKELMECVGYCVGKNKLRSKSGGVKVKQVIEFKADHGFHFYVVDRKEEHKINGKHTIYFVGQLTDPSNGKGKKVTTFTPTIYVLISFIFCFIYFFSSAMFFNAIN